MIETAKAMIGREARGPFARLTLLTIVVAASEGLGFVMLVPMLAALGEAGGIALPLGLSLPALSLGWLLGVFVSLVAIRSLAELLRSLAAQDLTAAVVDSLRTRALDALLAAEWRALSAMSQSENRALLLSSVERVGIASEILAEGLRAALSIAALTMAGLVIAPQAMGAGLVAGLLLAIVHATLRRRARRLGEDLTVQQARMHAGYEETLGGLRLVKSFGQERRAAEALRESLSGLRRAERQFVRDSGIARAALQIAAGIALAAFIALAVGRGNMPLAILLPLVALAIRAVPLLMAVQQWAQAWAREVPALEAATALIRQAERHREEGADEGEPVSMAERIELRGVSFTHAPGREALHGVSLVIGASEIAAITGPSGAGKSTLADILGGLLAPDGGEVVIDGKPLAPEQRGSWRRRVAYVQQEPVLFTGSIRDNLGWAKPDADERAMRAALEKAGADFVDSLPGGLDCALGESGRHLSGGQRQRIALARALLRQPDLLILDEATSAIDAGAEAQIAAALTQLRGACAILIIAHRGELAGLADRRYHLEQGALREWSA